MPSVKLVWITPDAEKIIGYCARVSSPANQDNPDVSKLLAYCIKHSHWSVFEMANMCLEIETSRDVSLQIVRHRSFSYQQFSLRYAEAFDYEPYPARRQDLKDRQNSIDDLDSETKQWWLENQETHWKDAFDLYERALRAGVAKEVARAVLPGQTKTRMYMNGTIRSWIHYLQVRTDKSVQLEHRQVATLAQDIFVDQLPIISLALGWSL